MYFSVLEIWWQNIKFNLFRPDSCISNRKKIAYPETYRLKLKGAKPRPVKAQGAIRRRRINPVWLKPQARSSERAPRINTDSKRPLSLYELTFKWPDRYQWMKKSHRPGFQPLDARWLHHTGLHFISPCAVTGMPFRHFSCQILCLLYIGFGIQLHSIC